MVKQGKEVNKRARIVDTRIMDDIIDSVNDDFNRLVTKEVEDLALAATWNQVLVRIHLNFRRKVYNFIVYGEEEPNENQR